MSSYFGRIWAAIRGQSPGITAGGDVDLQTRVASLEMDLREKTEQAEQMKREYATLEAARDRAASGAGQDQLERLFKKLAGPLSNLATLVSLCEKGQDVTAADMAQLVRSLEKQLLAAGMEPIGTPGEATAFDPAIHQRVSGGSVSTGTPVAVQLPGYRMGPRVIQKAMVSAAEPKATTEEGR